MPIQDLFDKPGYQIRRLRQIAGALFARESAAYGITSQQYTTLKALYESPPLEQVDLCNLLTLDRSTMATLLTRLEEKELVRRSAASHDKRRKYVTLTPRGRRLLLSMGPAIERVQARILAPLAPPEREAFARMLKALVDAHTDSDARESAEEAS